MRGERETNIFLISLFVGLDLVDKKRPEDCDVGHGGTSAAANPILISEEQKAKMWKKGRFVIGPPPNKAQTTEPRVWEAHAHCASIISFLVL